MWYEWIVAGCLLLGGFFCLVGSIGLVKMPDFYTRLHGPTKATTMGMAGVLVAAMVYFSCTGDEYSFKEALISIFLLITAPITGYILIKAGIHHKLAAIKDTKGQEHIE